MIGRPALLCLLLALPATGVGQSPSAASCQARPGAPRLDHVIVVVQNLDSARARLARLGFRVKAGRPHPNHLRNFHVKFLDGTGLEVMTVTGAPLDRNAEDYADLLAAGEGGAYVALRSGHLDSIAAAAERAGLTSRRSAIGTWQFLGFAPYSDASGVFFGSGWSAPPELDRAASQPGGIAPAGVGGGRSRAGPPRHAHARWACCSALDHDRFARRPRDWVSRSSGSSFRLVIRDGTDGRRPATLSLFPPPPIPAHTSLAG